MALDSSNRVPSTLRPRRRNPLNAFSPRALRVIPPCLLAAGFLAAASVASVPASPGARVAAPAAAVPKTVEVGKSARNALIIEGDDHLFMVAAPPGWILDDTSGMGSRIRCVFYPKGEKWKTAPTVMYVNPLHGFSSKARTMLTLIAEDEKAFKQRSPRGKVTEGGTLPTGAANKLARVRYFSDTGGPPQEAVAYVPEKELIMLVVLSAKSAEGFQKSLPAYRELVQSYAWVGTNAQFGR